MYERVIVPSNVCAPRPAHLPIPQPPLHAPAALYQIDPTVRTGILAYFSQLSDDGHFPLIEYVARDKVALQIGSERFGC